MRKESLRETNMNSKSGKHAKELRKKSPLSLSLPPSASMNYVAGVCKCHGLNASLKA